MPDVRAAVASARLGASTLLITADLNRVAQMSCNPAVGGIAKGSDCQGNRCSWRTNGYYCRQNGDTVPDAQPLQGPAVWSPRVQSDRTRFIDAWRSVLDTTPNLYLFQDMAVRFVFDESGEKLRL